MKKEIAFLFPLAILVIWLSSGCDNIGCDGLDDTASIVVVPTAMTPRTNTCPAPVDGTAPEDYSGPWNPSQSTFFETHARFSFNLQCSNPDCGDGGIIFRQFASDFSNMNGATGTFFETFNPAAVVPLSIFSIVYESSCTSEACTVCNDLALYNDLWVADAMASTVISGPDEVNVDAQMRYFNVQCNCGM